MKNSVRLAVISLSAFFYSLTASPVWAQSDFTHDAFGDLHSFSVGLHFKVPLDRHLRRAKREKPHFGLSLNADYLYRPGRAFFERPRQFRSEIVDLKFSLRGFENFAVGGRDMIDWRKGTFNADDDGEQKKKIKWGWVAAGVVVAVGVGFGVADFARNVSGSGGE